MGQAKSRGTREQRITEALGLVQRSLTDLKKDYDLPENAEFLGYGVHLPEPDEFLAQIDDDGYATKKIWAKDPQLAMTFPGVAEAHDVSQKCRGSIIVGMFDIGDQIFVAGITGNQTG